MANQDLNYNRVAGPGWGSRNPFWPNLVLLFGLGIWAYYQVVSMQNQLGSINHSIIELDPKVKRAQYEQAKLYGLAKAVLQLAPSDSNAAQIVSEYNVRSTTPAQATASTNAPPVNIPGATAH